MQNVDQFKSHCCHSVQQSDPSNDLFDAVIWLFVSVGAGVYLGWGAGDVGACQWFVFHPGGLCGDTSLQLFAPSNHRICLELLCHAGHTGAFGERRGRAGTGAHQWKFRKTESMMWNQRLRQALKNSFPQAAHLAALALTQRYGDKDAKFFHEMLHFICWGDWRAFPVTSVGGTV